MAIGIKLSCSLAVLIQLGQAGMMIISQLCFKTKHMDRYVLICYRSTTAALVLAPLAGFLERGQRPSMSVTMLIHIAALGCLGPILDQGFSYLGLHWTSAAIDAGMANCVPAVTFFLAVILGMEKFKMSEVGTRAKVAGTILTIMGTGVMTVYSGPVIPGTSHERHPSSSSGEGHMLPGIAVLLLGVVAAAGFYVVQSRALHHYPPLSLSCLVCVSGAIQSAVVGACVTQHVSPWALGLDSRLIAVLYTGIVPSALQYYVQGIVMEARGPVFLTAFNPLCLVMVSVLGAFILGEDIHLGSVLGSCVILGGVYFILWGVSIDRAEEEPPVTVISHVAEVEVELEEGRDIVPITT